MAHVNKVYTILKNSYNDNHESFMPNLFFANSSSFESIEVWFKKIINADDVKDVWISQKDNDNNIFYIKYTPSYESTFYHGFAVQELDLSNTKQNFINAMTNKTDWEKITDIAKKIIEERNKK